MDEPRVRLDVAAHRAWLDDRPARLRRLEFLLLAYLAAREGQVVTREEVMREVWGAKWVNSTKTLDMHISSLRRKLDDDATNPRCITTVRGVGFRLAPGTVEVVGRAADPHVTQIQELCARALAGVEAGWVPSEVGAFATSILAALEVADG